MMAFQIQNVSCAARRVCITLYTKVVSLYVYFMWSAASTKNDELNRKCPTLSNIIRVEEGDGANPSLKADKFGWSYCSLQYGTSKRDCDKRFDLFTKNINLNQTLPYVR